MYGKLAEWWPLLSDPADYAEAAGQIKAGGETTLELRRRLAAKVFARTAAYDAAIAAHLQKEFKTAGAPGLPPALAISAPLAQPLRYGENPHQAAALYGRFNEFFQQLHGKELSYNNILDLTAAAGHELSDAGVGLAHSLRRDAEGNPGRNDGQQPKERTSVHQN
jgi:AICAR transformylase/IMP cyclohydrolase PurH